MHVDLSIAGNSFCLGWMHDDGTCPVLSHLHRGASESLKSTLATKLFCHWLQIKFCHDTRSGMNELCILTVCRCVFNFRAVIGRREWSLSHKVIILSAVSVVLKLSFIMSLSWVLPSERLSVDEMNGTKYGQAVSPYARFSNTYDITLFQAPYHEPCCCFCSILCFPCAQLHMRHRVLNHVHPNSGWSNYKCFQGYFGGESCGDSECPVFCMCFEASCCPGLAVSATSNVIREQYQLGLDEDDVRLIRCHNCFQIFSICFFCVADDAVACIVDCIADVVFCSVSGCMTAQVHHEIILRKCMLSPQKERMDRY